MITKLHIDLLQGILDVEGEEPFVKSIYADFKERLHSPEGRLDAKIGDISKGVTKSVKDSVQTPKKRGNVSNSVKVASADAGNSRTPESKPKFNSSLDLGALESFYDQFKLKNNSEKILIFSIFIRDEIKKSPITSDDIYSCFFTLKGKSKIPEAFTQAIRDTSFRTKWIQYSSLSNIEVTIAGENYFHQKLKKKESSK